MDEQYNFLSMIPKWFYQLFPALVSILFLMLIVAQGIGLSDRARNASEKHTINITAEGKVTAKPDLATVIASVVTESDNAVNAQSDNTKKMNKVIEFIKNNGVKPEDITTQDYSIYPKYDYSNGRSTQTGYTATQTLTVKVRALENVGKILDGLTQNGINQIQNVQYSFDKPDDFRQQAREMALANAKEKAQKLANAAGVKLGKLVSFTENSNAGIIPVPYALDYAKGVGMGGGGTSQLEPGVQDITAQVSVTFELQ